MNDGRRVHSKKPLPERNGAPPTIGDYGLIGDCETAALISRDGSIDWLCWPRFDSGACFAALLGTREHGCGHLGPAGHIVGTYTSFASPEN